MSTFDDLPYEIVNYVLEYIECDTCREYSNYCQINTTFYSLLRGKQMQLTRKCWEKALETPWNEKYLVEKRVDSFSSYQKMRFVLGIEFWYYHIMYVVTGCVVVGLRNLFLMFAIPLLIYYIFKYSLFPLGFVDLFPIYLLFLSLLVPYCLLVVSKLGSYFTSLYLERKDSIVIIFKRGRILEGFAFHSVLLLVFILSYYFIWHRWFVLKVLVNINTNWFPCRVFFPIGWISFYVIYILDAEIRNVLPQILNNVLYTDPIRGKILASSFLIFSVFFGMLCDKKWIFGDISDPWCTILRIVLLLFAIPMSFYWEHLCGCMNFRRTYFSNRSSVSYLSTFMATLLHFFVDFRNFRLDYRNSKFELLYHVPVFCIISQLFGAPLIVVMIPIILALVVGFVQATQILKEGLKKDGILWKDLRFIKTIAKDQKICLFGFRDWLFYCFGHEGKWRLIDQERKEYVERRRKEGVLIENNGLLPI